MSNPFGDLLRRLRRDASLSQKQIARLLGYDHSLISRVETGRHLPAHDFVDRFADMLGLSNDQRHKLHEHYRTAALHHLGARHIDWGEAPDTFAFCGRTAELATLSQWLSSGCRLIGVFGIGGVGKTALAARLTELVHDRFDAVLWQSLRNAPPLEGTLGEAIRFFAPNHAVLPDGADHRLTLFMTALRKRRCLLVLDNVEAIMREGARAGSFRDGFADYARFFQQVGEMRHASCLLLTSREEPDMFAALEGDTVRALSLSGLSQADTRAMLDATLSGGDAAWDDLVRRYSGNPLALKLAAATIRDLYRGRIDDFLRPIRETPIFGNIRDVLDQQFRRLTVLERDIMLWLAIEREPVSPGALRADLAAEVPDSVFLESLNSLWRRSLIERGESGFTLQNVVMEYATTRLIDQVYAEIEAFTLAKVTKPSPGLLSQHALIKATAKDYVREAQVRLILKPIGDRLSSALGATGLNRCLSGWLDALRTQRADQVGYAAGNILNLLVQTNGESRGYNFSRLGVRQAYLRGVRVHDCDFGGVAWSESVFTEVFGSVLALAWSPDGKRLAVGGTSNEVRIFRTEDSAQIAACIGHQDWVRAVAFSPDGATLASASDDGTLCVWNTRTGQCLGTLRGHTGHVTAVAFSPDGATLASASADHTVRLWDLADHGRCRVVIEAHRTWINAVAFSLDGHTLISSANDGVCVWDARTGACLHARREPQHTYTVAALPGISLAVSMAGADWKKCQVWDLAEDRPIVTLRGHSDNIRSVAFSPNSRCIATGGLDRIALLWNAETGERIGTLQGHTGHVTAIAFHPAAENVIATGGDDGTIRLWDVSTGRCLSVIQGYIDQILSLALSANGDLLVSGHHDRQVRLWSLSRGACIAELSGHARRVAAVAFSPDDRLVASGGFDRLIRLWDAHAGQCLRVFEGHSAEVTALAFSPDGQTLISGSEDQTVRVWDARTGECLRVLRGHTMWVWTVAFSPDGTCFASGGGDDTVCVWDAHDWQCRLFLLDHHRAVWAMAFSPDGRLLATGGDDRIIRVWQTQSGTCLRQIEGHADLVRALAFSPDGHILASGSADQTIRLRDVETDECIHILHGHTGIVRSVVFTSDGQRLISGGVDNTICIWRIDPGIREAMLRPKRPYERMDITGVTGLTDAQKASLKALGAIEH